MMPNEAWFRDQLDSLPENDRDILFGKGTSALEVFLEIEAIPETKLLA